MTTLQKSLAWAGGAVAASIIVNELVKANTYSADSNETIPVGIGGLPIPTYYPATGKENDYVSYDYLTIPSDIIPNDDIETHLSDIIRNEIIPEYPIIKIGKTGTPDERKKKKDYKSKSILMFPLYVSDDREEIKELEENLTIEFMDTCNIFDCFCEIKNAQVGGGTMEPRNETWFFVYVVVYTDIKLQCPSYASIS